MSNIVSFLPPHAFDPETTQVMAAAFESAWEELKDTGHVASAPFRAHATREMLAKRIIQMARTGVRDPDVLRHEALLGVFESRLRKQA